MSFWCGFGELHFSFSSSSLCSALESAFWRVGIFGGGGGSWRGFGGKVFGKVLVSSGLPLHQVFLESGFLESEFSVGFGTVSVSRIFLKE